MSSLFFFLLARKWLICISTHKHTTRQLEQHYSVKVAKVVPTPPNNTVYNMYRNKRRLSQWAEKPYTSRWTTYTNINTLIILENEAESLRHRICAEGKLINKLFHAGERWLKRKEYFFVLAWYYWVLAPILTLWLVWRWGVFVFFIILLSLDS